MRYMHEQEEWDRFIQDSLGEKALLVHVSSVSSDCRVYKTPDAIFKIRRLTPASIRGRNNCLEDEYLVLKHLSSVAGIPKVRSYRRTGQWEQLEMELLPALHGYDPTLGRPHESLQDFWDVARVTLQINRLGCSHGDLHWCNVGRNIQGGMSVFDFDQACLEHPLRCALRDMFGLGTCEKRSTGSLWDRLQGVRGVGLLPRFIVKLSRRLANLIAKAGSPTLQQNQRSKVALLQRARLQADPSLELLVEAWNIASLANASSPGVDIAYYSLDIGGVNFPGERPWVLRWERIRKSVDFNGKRLLELGCNMGLLSIHAKLSGAAFCLGIDIDKDILSAANLASRAFGTDTAYRQLDLADSSTWEEELKGFDVVSVLSVLHWIEKKARVWAFIAQHKEVLYEGHESEQEAELSLRQAGFTSIVPLGVTERNRQMFYASRK